LLKVKIIENGNFEKFARLLLLKQSGNIKGLVSRRFITLNTSDLNFR